MSTQADQSENSVSMAYELSGCAKQALSLVNFDASILAL